MIDGTPAPDLFASLLEMEVEEDYRAAAMFRIKLAINREKNGLWRFLDDNRLKLWSKVELSVTLFDEKTLLMAGYVTQIRPSIATDENASVVEIYGLDGSCLMSMEEKINAWPNKSDSDIARTVFQSYNLTPEVEDTQIVHDEAVATIIQRETDIQFLKRLARRNGFECFVKGDKGYFRKPVLIQVPQPVLAAHFGPATNLVSFEARLNALKPAAVEMHQIDTIGKQIQSVAVDTSQQRHLGRDNPASVSAPGGIGARLFVKHAMATGLPEMENLCRALFDEGEWLIEAKGELESVAYGTVLQARSLVPIKGVGEIFSGLYYVTKVKHLFKVDRYTQQFMARRNALAPTGPSDFPP